LSISSGMRLHFNLQVGFDSAYFPAKLRNKDKVILHLLNSLKWKVTLPNEYGEDDYLTKSRITLKAVDPEEDLVKALRALMKIRRLRREEAERLKRMPVKNVCRELALKFLIG